MLKAQRISVHKNKITGTINYKNLYPNKYDTHTLYDCGYGQPEKLAEALESLFCTLMSGEIVFNDSAHCDIRYAYLKAFEFAKKSAIEDGLVSKSDNDAYISYSFYVPMTYVIGNRKEDPWESFVFPWEGIVLKTLEEFKRQFHVSRELPAKKDWVISTSSAVPQYVQSAGTRRITIAHSLDAARKLSERDAYITFTSKKETFKAHGFKPRRIE